MVYILGIIPIHGRPIQVSEILQFTHIPFMAELFRLVKYYGLYPYIYIYIHIIHIRCYICYIHGIINDYIMYYNLPIYLYIYIYHGLFTQPHICIRCYIFPLYTIQLLGYPPCMETFQCAPGTPPGAAPIFSNAAIDTPLGRWSMGFSRACWGLHPVGSFRTGNDIYPLVNYRITMENHHFSWENPP